VVLCSEYRHPSTVQHCHDGNESGRVDLIPGSKIGCDGHQKNPLLAENRRYAAMNFGYKVRDGLLLLMPSAYLLNIGVCGPGGLHKRQKITRKSNEHR